MIAEQRVEQPTGADAEGAQGPDFAHLRFESAVCVHPVPPYYFALLRGNGFPGWFCRLGRLLRI
jgi:hypothetical protein